MASQEATHEMSTPESSSTIILPDAKREVIYHKFEIRNQLHTALKNIKSGDNEEIERNIRSIHANIIGLEKYLSMVIETKYYNEYRKPGDTAATRVFAIPELLFAILESVDIVELMHCYGVNRLCRDTIERSEKLQTKLFLRTRPADSSFKMLPLELPYFKRLPTYGRNTIRFEITVRSRANSQIKLPSIGTRWKKMLISHPPTYSILVRFGQFDFDFMFREGPDYVKETPITVGDLFECAERRLREADRDSLLVREDGRVAVEFEGTAGE